MRLGFLFLLLIATLFGSGFWYDSIQTTCKMPIRYHIGTIDERFGTSVDEVKRIAANAEALWEDALHTDIFVYDETDAGVTINFIFDKRQEDADHEAELRADLDAKEGMSESVARQYETLIAEFRKLKKEYESRVVAYETALQTYNNEVASWNDKGGAPETVIEKLRERSKKLESEQSLLTTRAEALNAVVMQLNRIGAQGNELTTNYNTIVNEYNNEIADAHEFAQGDYLNKNISIYQFDSEDELTLVLAHELGHTLSLKHVLGEKSIMYYLMGSQTVKGGVQDEDIAEFKSVCSQKSFLQRALSLAMEGWHFAL